ncbi:MAG: PAS domain S-box protein [Methanotrichaceae archaeon]
MSDVNLSERVSKLSQTIEELQAKYANSPANAPEILSEALKSLHMSLEDLHEELKRAKLEAKNALVSYSDLYEFSPIGLFTLDNQGRILEANAAGAKLLGMARSRLLNKHFRQFVKQNDQQPFDDFCKIASETSGKQTCELSLVKKNGPIVYAHIDGIATENRSLNIKQIRMAITDITERKQAEKATLEREKFRTVADFAYDWEAWLDTSGNYVYVSPSCERITGYRSEEFMKNPRLVLDIVHPDDRAAFEDHRNDHFNGRAGSGQIDFRIITSKGEIRWINHLCQPVFGNNEEWLGRRASNRDITDRKAAEEALHEKDRLLAESQNMAKVGSWEMDLSTGNVIFSDEMLRILGLSQGQHSYDELWSRVHPDEKEKRDAEIKYAIDKNTPYSCEYRIALPDGDVRYIYAIGKVIRDSHGIPIKFAVTAQDITERKRTENTLQEKQEELEAQAEELKAQAEELLINNEELERQIEERKRAEKSLKESEERYYRLFEDDLTGDFIASPDGQILVCNPAFVKIFGFSSRDEAIGSNLAELYLHPEEYAAFIEHLCEQKVLERYECNYCRLDGATIRTVENIVGTFDEQGNLVQFKGYVFDDTERKRAEEALREAKDNLEIHVKERTAELEQANAQLQIEIAERKRAEAELDRYRTQLEDLVIERTFKLEAANTKLQSEIAERKRMEEELRKSKDELEQKVKERTEDLFKANEKLQAEIAKHQNARKAAEAAAEAKAAFLANMSHELRTPMNYIMGIASLLLDEPMTPKQKEYIEIVKEGGNRMITLINDILEISKLGKKKVALESKPLDLMALIGESMDMVASQAKKKGLRLTTKISYGTPGKILGDYGKLRQILINLLSNAIKFTEKGEITVFISSKALETGGLYQLTFAVKDTGVGISPENLDKLFQPFGQMDMSFSRGYEGAGLGLAISKELVELMGGRIWAESKPGDGSTLTFIIEAEVISNRQNKPIDSDIKDNTAFENIAVKQPLRILVAEDDTFNRRTIVDTLEKMGFRPDAVADGNEAIEALECRPYDLILMDVKMPHMDGIKATHEIRKRWSDNGPKIIAITAYALDGDREKCLEAGMDDYIAKPVQKEELAEVLKRCASKTH